MRYLTRSYEECREVFGSSFDLERKMKSRRLLLAAGILFLCWYLSAHWFQLMLIQGDSMLPSYHNLQLVVLDKHSREFHTGDVIAFRCENLSAVLVKRIVACGGDWVQIADGTLYVNGEVSPLYEEDSFDNAGILQNEVKLSTGDYIVIGDNAAQSRDSRDERVGVIQEDSVIGKILNAEMQLFAFR